MSDWLFKIVGVAVFLLFFLGLSKFLEMKKKADAYGRMEFNRLNTIATENFMELGKLVNEKASPLFIYTYINSMKAYGPLNTPGSVEYECTSLKDKLKILNETIELQNSARDFYKKTNNHEATIAALDAYYMLRFGKTYNEHKEEIRKMDEEIFSNIDLDE